MADDAAKRVPQDASDLDSNGRARSRYWIAVAVNAIEEVLKAMDLHGAVPRTAIFTSEGQAIYDREPGRFRRSRLETVLEVYRRKQRELA